MSRRRRGLVQSELIYDTMTNSLMIDLAVRAIQRGGVIAYPTEAVWGLGCNPFSEPAVARLCQLKLRNPSKGLILVAADEAQLSQLLAPLPSQLRKRISKSWPGPVTWVVPASGLVPGWITGRHDSVAVRVSAHPVIAALCRRFEAPIVSTSANPAGRAPAGSSLQVRRYFGDRIDFFVPGRTGGQKNPTRIHDALSGLVIRGD